MSASPQARRREAASNLVRAEMLAELAESPIPLTTVDFSQATGESSVTWIVYHLRALADAGWIEFGGDLDGPPDGLVATLRDDLPADDVLAVRAAVKAHRAERRG